MSPLFTGSVMYFSIFLRLRDLICFLFFVLPLSRLFASLLFYAEKASALPCMACKRLLSFFVQNGFMNRSRRT